MILSVEALADLQDIEDFIAAIASKRRKVRSTSYSNDFAYWNHFPKPVGRASGHTRIRGVLSHPIEPG